MLWCNLMQTAALLQLRTTMSCTCTPSTCFEVLHMMQWCICINCSSAHKAIPPIHVKGQQDIMPLPSTTTATTPKRTNKSQNRKNSKIILKRNPWDKGHEQQEFCSPGKYVQRSETARKLNSPFVKDKLSCCLSSATKIHTSTDQRPFC